MNVSNSTSVNTVASAPQQQTAAPSDTRQKQDSVVVKLSEQAQQASRAENQANAARNEAKAQGSKASSEAAAARSAEASKAQTARAETKGINTFA